MAMSRTRRIEIVFKTTSVGLKTLPGRTRWGHCKILCRALFVLDGKDGLLVSGATIVSSGHAQQSQLRSDGGEDGHSYKLQHIDWSQDLFAAY